MTHAYNELYLNDAMKSLAVAFDYAINVCEQNADWFAKLFVQSGVATLFEIGNPAIVSGKSGKEIVLEILNEIYQESNLPIPYYLDVKTPEYWAGWALAQYQWTTCKKFKDIFERIPLSEIILMYPLYHEMDISRFIETMEKRYYEVKTDTKLQTIRKSRDVSQAELAKLSGVSLRSIQLYEQRVNDIDKAQVHTLYKISKVLGCNIEDLLENAETI